MIGHPASPGLCQGKAATDSVPSQKSVGRNHSNASYFGDPFRTKRAGVSRIVMFNPHGMGVKHSSDKMTRLRDFLRRHSVDLIGLNETNVDWRLMKTRATMWGRMQGWFEAMKISVSHNRQAPRKKKYQAGGNALIGINRMAHCVDKCGGDSRDLGRWSWMLLKGKGNIKTRVVTVYCPCRSSASLTESVYQQQKRYFLGEGMEVCPREQFWQDLLSDIDQWKESGEQLVIGGDWNTPIEMVNKRLAPVGLTEVITSTHGLDHAPPTFNVGSRPIDGIFLSATLRGVRCGYLPFNKGPTVDHRILWVDIPNPNLLGFNMAKLDTPKARRLQLHDPRVVAKYQSLFHSFCLKHNLYDRSAAICRQAVYPLPLHLQLETITVDRLRVQGMEYAESKCCKLYMGVYDWSPMYTEAKEAIRFWTMAKQRAGGIKIDTKRLLRMIRRGFPHPALMSPADIQCKVDEAWAHSKQVKKDALKNRVSYQASLAQALKEAGKGSAASALKSLQHREELRRNYKSIKFTLKKLFSGSTHRILVPAKNGEGYREVTDRDELEKLIIAANVEKYHRTESYCPLLQGQLLDDIGVLCDGPRVSDILSGTYTPPPGTTRGTRAYLRHMQQRDLPPAAMERATRSNIEEFCSEWRRVKEHTSSHGTLHYGHFKAGCAHHSIRQLHFNMAEIGMISGFYLDRHRLGTDCELLKSEDDFRLEKLRTICLFDAELNMNQRRMGKGGLHAEILAGTFAKEQYSRPCRSALDHVINRRLSFDYFAFRRLPFGLLACDLAGNYDRIVHSAATLALLRAGVPYPRVRGMFHTLQNMLKRIKTAFGLSSCSYGGSTPDWPFQYPQQGVFQGNAVGPPLWSIISSTVFTILQEEGYGVSFDRSLGGDGFHMGGFAYVDDTDLLQGGQSPVQVADDMRDALQLWEELMHTTGQCMAPSKSWWYLVDHVCRNGEWVIEDSNVYSDLVARDSDGAPVSLKRLMSTESTKMLGVYMSPSGDQSAEYTYLQSKINTWVQCISCGHLGPTETWLATSTCIWKTLLYPLPATSFTETQISSLVWPIIKVAFPAIGLTPSFPVALRYGPPKLGGVDLVDPLLHQGASKVQYLVEHPWKNTPTGCLVHADMEALTLESGLFGSPFSFPYNTHGTHLAFESWVLDVWEFVTTHSITFTGLPFPTCSPKRVRDVSIMEFLSRRRLTPLTLRRLNACRIYLRVVSVSDIVDVTGCTIVDDVIPSRTSLPTGPLCRNEFSWPRQPQLPRSFWTLWRKEFLDVIADSRHKLTVPLGPWLQPELQPDTYHCHWDWFSLPSDGTSPPSIWRHHFGTWTEHRGIASRSRRHRFFDLTGSTLPQSGTPENLQLLARISVSSDTSGYKILTLHSPRLPLVQPPAVLQSIAVSGAPIRDRLLAVLSTRSEYGWLIQDFSCSGSLDILLREFVAGLILSVSDGSFLQRRSLGSASWILESRSSHQFIRCSCLVPGPLDDQSAYRSELTGILGITFVVWGLTQLCSPEKGCEVVVGCDGYSALYRAFVMEPERLSSRYPCFDVVSAIMGYWCCMDPSAFPIYVRGHADDDAPVGRLSRLELMNIAMDRAAKDALSASIAQSLSPPIPTYHFGMPVVHLHGSCIVADLCKSIILRISYRRARDFWRSSWNMPDLLFESLAWPSIERAFTGVPRHRRFFVTSWLSRQLRSASSASSRSVGISSTFCHHCRSSEQFLPHTLRCRKFRPKVVLALDVLRQWMVDEDTDPDLCEGIYGVLLAWVRRQDVPISTLPPCLVPQATVGWYNLFQGIHHSCIVVHQTRYFRSIRSGRSTVKWHSRLIRKLWDILSDVYVCRSDTIHSLLPEVEDDDVELVFARDAALVELRRGLRGLPVLYSPYFRITEECLLSKQALDLHRWFKTVRRGREIFESSSLDQLDEFSPSGQFRAWLDL